MVKIGVGCRIYWTYGLVGIPGQGKVLHSLTSVPFPWQNWPPLIGEMHSLDLSWVPPSHDAVQLPQLVHGPHLPSTLQRIVLEGVIKSICKQSYLGKRCRLQLQYHFWVSSSSQQRSTCPWTLDGNGGSRQHHVDHHLAHLLKLVLKKSEIKW